VGATIRSSRVRWILGVLVLASTVTPVAAQDITGAMQGTLISPEGKPEPEVHITVSGPHLQGSRETTTNRDGFFQLLLLPPGRYTLTADRQGLRPLEVREIEVALGRTTAVGPLTVILQPIPMAPVVVDKAPLKLDPVHTSAGGDLSARDYDDLPVDRDYKSLIAILPQVNDSYRGDPLNVAGSTGLENQYYIDGVNVTDTRDASRATSLPYNFVRAVDVKTGGYEAQYGRALGAVVDAVTYSGTNDLEANVFGFVQPVALSLTPRAEPVMAEHGAVSYDLGGRVSGPLLQDRLWFSVALNPRVDQVDKEITGHGLFPDCTSAVRFASKLTWRASPANNVELSVFGDPTVQDQVAPVHSGIDSVTNPDPLLRRLESGGTVASLRWTWVPKPTFLLQSHVAGQWDRNSSVARTSGGTSDWYLDYVEGTEGGSYSSAIEDRRMAIPTMAVT
jgi:hypothetical protein